MPKPSAIASVKRMSLADLRAAAQRREIADDVLCCIRLRSSLRRGRGDAIDVICRIDPTERAGTLHDRRETEGATPPFRYWRTRRAGWAASLEKFSHPKNSKPKG